LAQVLQTFWAKKPCKKSADLHPRQGNLLHTLEHFYRAQQNLSSLHKIGWRSAEKNLPVFFQHASSRSKISMATTHSNRTCGEAGS
jgi:hypothetical protein